MQVISIAVLLFALGLGLPTSALAYIDPGAGSVIVQVIIAGIVTGLFLIKTFFANIKNFFLNLVSKQKGPQNGTQK
jgi:hypothetical protein